MTDSRGVIYIMATPKDRSEGAVVRAWPLSEAAIPDDIYDTHHVLIGVMREVGPETEGDLVIEEHDVTLVATRGGGTAARLRPGSAAYQAACRKMVESMMVSTATQRP